MLHDPTSLLAVAAGTFPESACVRSRTACHIVHVTGWPLVLARSLFATACQQLRIAGFLPGGARSLAARTCLLPRRSGSLRGPANVLAVPPRKLAGTGRRLDGMPCRLATHSSCVACAKCLSHGVECTFIAWASGLSARERREAGQAREAPREASQRKRLTYRATVVGKANDDGAGRLPRSPGRRLRPRSS
jgi:hypothetical protein